MALEALGGGGESGLSPGRTGSCKTIPAEQMANISFLSHQLEFGVLHFIFTLYPVSVQTLTQLIITCAYRAKNGSKHIQ